MDSIFQGIVAVLTSFAVSVAGMFGFVPEVELIEPLGGDVVQVVGGEVYRLAGSGVTAAATSVTLTDFDVPNTSQDLAMTDFGEIGYGTLDPGTSKREFISFTGVTQNADDSATLTGVLRGLSPISPWTASTTHQQAHSGGARFILSDPPNLWARAAFKDNTETVTKVWTFDADAPPTLDATGTTATSSAQLVSKEYVDNSVNQGAATSTEATGGIVEMATITEVASTTQFDANNPHVINSEFATSTPAVGCEGGSTSGALCVVVAENDGNINQGWLDLTESFTYSGGLLVTATSTFTATTTINATATSSNALILNGQAYAFPSSSAASSTVLSNDGTGDLSWVPPDWEQLGETVLGGANATTTVNVSARNTLRVIIEIPGASAASFNTALRFNTDGAGNYGYSVVEAGTALTSGSSQIAMFLHTSGTSTPQFITVDIVNDASRSKKAIWSGSSSFTGAVAPMQFNGVGVWNNTSDQITAVHLVDTNASATADAGTRVTVYGSRD